MKIAIGLPTNRLIKPKTALSILQLVDNSKYDYKFIVSTRGYNTAENRNRISALAVNNGCTHIFCVDDDMIYEPDTLDKLLANNKDIVGGLYNTKYEEQDYVIEYLGNSNIPDETFECGALGTGLLLIKTDVFKKIPQPWFGYIWHDNGMVHESIDWFFCHKARKNGFKVYCDPKVKAKHIGLYEY